MRFIRECLGIELSVVSSKERFISGVGGIFSILFLVFLHEYLLPLSITGPMLGSIAASAVLLFAVPHGQLSQPWPVIAGHVLSATVGVLCAQYLTSKAIAAPLAVGLSIGLMHQFKCIHPPGGATALLAVTGGSAIDDLKFDFVLFPVLTDAVAITVLGVLFNAFFPWRRYPASLSCPASIPKLSEYQVPSPTHEEIVEALRSLDSFEDVTEADLRRLSQILASTSKRKLRKPVRQRSHETERQPALN